MEEETFKLDTTVEVDTEKLRSEMAVILKLIPTKCTQVSAMIMFQILMDGYKEITGEQFTMERKKIV